MYWVRDFSIEEGEKTFFSFHVREQDLISEKSHPKIIIKAKVL
jgi:hypothetical protein